MSFPTLVFDEKKKAQFEAEGRGTKEGAEWRAWYQFGDFRPHFRTQDRFTCLYTRRSVFLPTAQMRRCWHALELEEDTVEILEFYPLDRNVTRQIARTIGVDHPQDAESKVDLVLTTSLVVKTRVNGQIVRQPVHCGTRTSLEKYAQVEELQIQAAYWQSHGLRLRVFTGCETCLPRAMSANIETLATHRLPQMDPPDHPGRFQAHCDRVFEALRRSASDNTFTEWAHLASPELQMTPPTVIDLLLHMIARRRIRLDLTTGPALRQRTNQAVLAATSTQVGQA